MGNKVIQSEVLPRGGFVFVKETSNTVFGDGKVYKNLVNGELVVLISQTFNSEELFADSLQQLERQSFLSHSNLIRLLKHSQIKSDGFCSSYWRIQALYEFFDRNLKMEIEERFSFDRNFKEKEIFYLAEALLGAVKQIVLSRGFHGEIAPNRIFISEQGGVKIFEGKSNRNSNLFGQSTFSGSGENLYVSPKVFEAYDAGKCILEERNAKNDVFGVGMVLLEVAGMESVQGVYNFESWSFYRERMMLLLNKLEDKYSKDLVNFLRSMLTIEEDQRPQINILLKQLEKLKKSGKEFSTSLELYSEDYSIQIEKENTNRNIEKPKIFFEKTSENNEKYENLKENSPNKLHYESPLKTNSPMKLHSESPENLYRNSSPNTVNSIRNSPVKPMADTIPFENSSKIGSFSNRFEYNNNNNNNNSNRFDNNINNNNISNRFEYNNNNISNRFDNNNNISLKFTENDTFANNFDLGLNELEFRINRVMEKSKVTIDKFSVSSVPQGYFNMDNSILNFWEKNDKMFNLSNSPMVGMAGKDSYLEENRYVGTPIKDYPQIQIEKKYDIPPLTTITTEYVNLPPKDFDIKKPTFSFTSSETIQNTKEFSKQTSPKYDKKDFFYENINNFEKKTIENNNNFENKFEFEKKTINRLNESVKKSNFHNNYEIANTLEPEIFRHSYEKKLKTTVNSNRNEEDFGFTSPDFLKKMTNFNFVKTYDASPDLPYSKPEVNKGSPILLSSVTGKPINFNISITNDENPRKSHFQNPLENQLENPMENPLEIPLENHMENPLGNSMGNPMGNPMGNSMGKPMGNPLENSLQNSYKNPIENSFKNYYKNPFENTSFERNHSIVSSHLAIDNRIINNSNHESQDFSKKNDLFIEPNIDIHENYQFMPIPKSPGSTRLKNNMNFSVDSQQFHYNSMRPSKFKNEEDFKEMLTHLKQDIKD